jgi:threonine dehydrogenase-like Zn-dependent dehydrogenase
MSGVELLRSGVCGTDLQLLNGDRPGRATVLGHEGVGLRRGSHGATFVVFNPVDPVDPDTVLGHSYDGIFRSHLPMTGDHVPQVVPVSPRLLADLAPLVEPLGVALYAWELITDHTPAPGRVGVWGAGPAAALQLMSALHNGSTAVLFHRSPERMREITLLLDIADRVEQHRTEDLCADTVAPVDAAILCVPRRSVASALAQARECTVGDGIIDTYSGMNGQDALADMVNSVRRANTSGRGPARRVRLADAAGTHWLTGHRGTSAAHLRASEALLLSSPEQWLRTITHVVGLSRLRPLLSEMAHPPAGGHTYPSGRLKVVVDHTLEGSRAPDPRVRLEDLELDEAPPW